MFKGEKVCSCFGHFKVVVTRELRERASEAIDKAVEEGVRIFIVGGANEFEAMVKMIVTCMQKDDPKLNIKISSEFPPSAAKRDVADWIIQTRGEIPTEEELIQKAIFYRTGVLTAISDMAFFYAKNDVESPVYKAYLRAKNARKNVINFAVLCNADK